MNNHSKNIPNIVKNLMIFKNIPVSEIETIILFATLNNVKKNKILLLKEQEIKFFYILISGSAILFENDNKGNRYITQLLNEGDIVGDVFTKNFVFSAYCNEDCQILAIPINYILDLAKNNLIFSNNLLKEIVAKNYKILNLLTLHKSVNAKYRILQFFQSLAIENNPDINVINLKFSKAVIASYLNIKPETFSRILQDLKNCGEISVNGNEITIYNDTINKYKLK